jgi:hypothetical protein
MATLCAVSPAVLPVASASAANPYDTAPQALVVPANTTTTITSTADATDTGEPGTCTAGFFVQTVWYRFHGTGGPVTLATLYSDFDTVMTVFVANGPQAGAQQGDCSDDAPGAGVTSRIVLNTVAGQDYLVQVGGCALVNRSPCGGGTPTRQFGKAVLTVLGNDARASAETLVAGTTITRTNIDATTGGEPVSCEGQSYSRTVWFAFDAPSAGTATIDVGGQSTVGVGPVVSVVTTFRAGDPAPAAPCVLGSFVGNTNARQQLAVGSAGRYEVQVGSRNTFDTDLMSVAYAFDPVAPGTPNADLDGDHVTRPDDCDDNNAAIHPGAVDVPFDGIDQDCKGGDNKDRDGDGFAAKPFGKDCNDRNKAINPSAKERRGNWVDENCDKRAAAGTASRQPDVACTACSTLPATATFGGFVITRVRQGDVVIVRCRGTKQCPQAVRKVVKKKKTRISIDYSHVLPRRTAIVEVFVERPGSNVYGFYLRYRSGKRKAGCATPPAGQHSGAPKHPVRVACPG